MKRCFALLLLFFGLPGAVWAQSSPGLVYGQVPTAAQWNSYFSAKQDFAHGLVTGPSSATSGHSACWGTFPALTDCGAPPTIAAGNGITITGSGPSTIAITAGGVTNSLLASMASNTVKANVTGSLTVPQDTTLPSCSTAGSALRYTSAVGFGCNTAISAASVNGDANVAFLDVAQTFTAAQRSTKSTITISTATFTPNFNTGQDFEIGLTSACPCTLANPSTTPVAGQKGVFYFTQDATGSRVIGTWGSQYLAAGGTSTIVLSTGANAIDVISYVVKDATHIVLSAGALNVSH